MRLNIYKWAGVLGLALIIAAAAFYAARGLADLYTWLPLGLGAGGLGLYLSRYHGETRALLTSRGTRYGANALVLTLAVLAMFSFAQAIVGNHDLQWDMTKNKINTLSDQTIKAVKGLEMEVRIFHFHRGDGSEGRFEVFLRKIRALNPSRFKYELLDINKNPLKAQEYSVRSVGTSVLVIGNRHESFTGTKEEDLVNALAKVTSTGTKVVYMLTGHGELALEGADNSAANWKQAMENGTFMVREINLLAAADVPADCAALVIAGPQTDLVQLEIDRLKAYLARGGQLLAAVDPRVPVNNFRALFDSAGVKVNEDIVVDQLAVFSGGQPLMPPARDFDRVHPVTKDLQRGQIMLPITRSLELKTQLPEGVKGTVLAKSNPTAWAYTGTANRIPPRPGPTDTKGPVNLALAVEAPAKLFSEKEEDAVSKPARMVLLGSSRIISNESFGIFNNPDFVLNAVRWLSGDEKKISIAPKNPESTPLVLDQSQANAIWIICMFVIPGLVLLTGLVVHIRRRRAA